MVFEVRPANLGIQQAQVEDKRVIEILERMEKNQQEFFAEVFAMLLGGKNMVKVWGDLIDVQDFLGVSRRTVYRILEEYEIRERKVLGKTLYFLPDFFDLKKKYLK